jgi:hypothetical protein
MLRGVPDQTRAELEALSTDELRKRAFHRAERHADVGFFWDLIRHLPSSNELSGEDGSLGSVSDSIGSVIELARELMGKDLGGSEPMLRARFIDYLTTAES